MKHLVADRILNEVQFGMEVPKHVAMLSKQSTAITAGLPWLDRGTGNEIQNFSILGCQFRSPDKGAE